MDRLVCGDVGFGKTEVAMRAAFIATRNQKQVAVLVPTTLLAQQHYNSFCDRFADWPVNVEVVSRFKTGKQQKETLEKVAKKYSSAKGTEADVAAIERAMTRTRKCAEALVKKFTRK